MAKIKEYKLIIGGEFKTQPKHKPKSIPDDFLAQFYNVNPGNLEAIVSFSNNYSFSGYIVPDQENSIRNKFSKIQAKYKPILKKLINSDTINYSDIEIINEDLKYTSPKICLRDKMNDLNKIANGFDVFTLKNVENEKPDISIQPIGAFEIDRKAAHIQVIVAVPQKSKTRWYFDRIKDGLIRISEIFPSENWKFQKEYLNSIILTNGNIYFNEIGQPVSIEMNFWLGKTDFTKEELIAVWSTKSASGESFIAKRIWDYLNTEYIGKKFKLCKICGNLYIGRSTEYCEKEGCRKEWDSKRKQLKK